ncbi:MAG: bifunctional lysylphosphatidylglycerol flippase/synthetase MprF [Lysobacter sp.]
MPEAAPVPPSAGFRRWRRALPVMLSLGILALALHALAREFPPQGYAALRTAIAQLDAGRIALALLFGLGSHACLIGFDAIGLRRSGRRVRPLRLVITAFLANAVGHLLGFAALTGGAVRWRGYGGAGLGAVDIGQVVLTSTLGFLFGAWVLLASALTFEPAAAALALPVSTSMARLTGLLLAGAYVVLLAMAGRDGRNLHLGVHRLWLPDRRSILQVSLLSVVELAFASAALYVLLAPLPETGFVGFVGLWLIAVMAGLVSSVPGGLGVFEWSLLKLLPGSEPAGLLAAALVYRITYYLVPLALAASLATVATAAGSLAKGTGPATSAWRVVRPWLPQVVALAVFVVGAALVIDGTLPTPRHRLVGTALPVVETSHLLASLGGVALVLIGQGLQRRSHAAWLLSLTLCIVLPVPMWFRGSHLLVWLAVLLVAMVLWVARREFYREGALLDQAWSWPWLRNVGLVLVATSWLLFFAYRHVEYQQELWWRFALSDDAPRALRAWLVVAVAVMVFGLARLLRSARAPLPPADAPALSALAPVLAAAQDVQANLVLVGDKALLCDDAGSGFVMMQRYGGSLIAMGDPVGPPEVARALVWRFRERADRLGMRPVFYQVGERYWQTYLDLGLSLVKLGEEALVPLADFDLQGRARAELRQAWNRGTRSALVFRVAAASEVDALMPTLAAISDDWLGEKSGSEKGFSLGHFDPVYLRRFPVAMIEVEGRVVAFANLWLAPAGGDFSVDLMRYLSDAPKGTMDFLFIELLLWGRANGYARFSLGMAPLSGLATHRLAGHWSRVGNLIARHGERFYDFGGLRHFKAKFDPVWKPRYLVTPGGMHLPAALLDVTRLISRDPRERDERTVQGTWHFR